MSGALVIIPTFNERESLPRILDRVIALNAGVDVLVVDDGSPDGTGTIADGYASRHPSVFVLHRTAKDGLGRAYIAGFTWAFERDYDWVLEMDADGSHDPRDIVPLLALATSTNADLVIGSRWIRGGLVEGWSRFRRALSSAGNAYARLALRSTLHDLTAGFRVIRVDRLRTLGLDTIASSGYCFQIEVAHRIELAGGEVREYPVRFVEREFGASKMHAGIVLEALARITGWAFTRRGR